MDVISTSLVGTIAGLVGVLLALSILVQVIQELWKFLTSSKSRAYAQVLQDFLGPWAGRLLRPGVLPDFTVRTAFQVLRLRPRGALLPLGRRELVAGLERTAPAWVQRTLEILQLETEIQGGRPNPPSPGWRAYLDELGATEKGAQGYWLAREIALFLAKWGHPLNENELGTNLGVLESPVDEMSAAQIQTAFRRRYVPHVVHAERGYDQMMSNFEYAYDRRNIRQTFTIALLVAVTLNVPFDRIYLRASALTPEQATALLEQAQGMYETLNADSTAEAPSGKAPLPNGGSTRKLLDLADQAVTLATKKSDSVSAQRLSRIVGWDELAPNFATTTEGLLYLLGCLLTAILVSFGAPFWNNLAGTVLQYQRGAKASRTSSPEGAA